MVRSTILTPSQAAIKNQQLPKGYLFVPTGFLSSCNGKRKRRPTERGEELHSILDRERERLSSSSTSTPYKFVPYVAKPKKVPSKEELAAKEKEQKITLLKKRLLLLKSRQAVLAAAQPPPTATTLLVPERATKTPRGRRVKKPVVKDLPSSTTLSSSSSSFSPSSYTPSPSYASSNGNMYTDIKSSRRSGRVIKTPKFLSTSPRSPPSTPAPKKHTSTAKKGPAEGTALKKQLAALNASVVNLSKQLAQKPVVERAPKVPKNIETVPLTNREKQMLKADIFKLPSNKLDPIIQMCSRNSGVEDKNEDSITIDIDKLDIPTLRELQKYVKKCIGQINRKTKKDAQDSPATNSFQSPLVHQSPRLPAPSPTKPPTQVTSRAPQRHASDSESESDSSSGSSESESDEAEEEKAPLSTPQLTYPSSLPVFDASAWNNLGSSSRSAVPSHGDGLWREADNAREHAQDQRNRREVVQSIDLGQQSMMMDLMDSFR